MKYTLSRTRPSKQYPLTVRIQVIRPPSIERPSDWVEKQIQSGGKWWTNGRGVFMTDDDGALMFVMKYGASD
jgi:hypothetical protein